MKRGSLLLSGIFCLMLALPAFAACGEEVRFSGETLEPGEVRMNVEDGVGYLRWAEVDGASGYTIARSESRFGNYTPVETDGALKSTRFEVKNFCYDYYRVYAEVNGKQVEVGEPISAFSENTLVVSPTDDMQKVQAYIDEKHSALEKASSGQFSGERFAILLLPGEYPELEVKLGYYTSVSGLGATPGETVIGKLFVSSNVLANNNATCTFWRSAENLTADGDTEFAVSQATSLRRIQVNGDLALSHASGWSSGGFLANSYVTGTVKPGTQQQWMSRNDEWGSWNSGGSHNYVFSGCVGSIPKGNWSESGVRTTILDQTEAIAEKPYLYYDAQSGYSVFVPDVVYGSRGTTWRNGHGGEAGASYPLDDFYVASAETDDETTLNAALAAGKHLLFTPGRYLLKAPLEVKNQDAVVMGLGYATLEIAAQNTDCAIRVADVDGVRLCDLLVDAGNFSKNMVVVGDAAGSASHAEDPIVLSNLFLRIGGVANVHTETQTAMVIYADDTIGDNFWIWRADHSQGVAWEDTPTENGIDYGNPVGTGLCVEGDNVACYALMVEHCENYQTLWKGENGLTVMYQSETPYRVPSQDKWMSENGKNGCASYKVADGVTTHRAYGIGIYLVNYSGVNLASAIEVPEGEGILMNHLVVCSFAAQNGSTISNVINDFGGAVGENSSRRLVEQYPKRT